MLELPDEGDFEPVPVEEEDIVLVLPVAEAPGAGLRVVFPSPRLFEEDEPAPEVLEVVVVVRPEMVGVVDPFPVPLEAGWVWDDELDAGGD
jgi:hypothetical protein